MNARQETITLAGERLVYTVRRSRRARHVLLQVDEGGGIEVVVPWWAPLHQAASLVRDKHRWLRRQRTRRPGTPQRSWQDGSMVPFLGEQLQLRLTVEAGRQRATVIRHGHLLQARIPTHVLPRTIVAAWYARQARIFFTRATQAAAERLGAAVTRISVGNHKTQWGSCGRQGQLSFNWRLLLGPRWVAEYVVAHEVAHLVHHNHSQRYWAVVKKIYPDYQAARRWLREHANELHW
jgi:predicted metal-dependent hydrolase